MAMTVGQIAAALQASVMGNAQLVVRGVAEPASASRTDLALAMTPGYAEALGVSQARAAVVWPGADWRAFGLEAAIEVPRARLAMAMLTRALDDPPDPTGVHSSALVHETARIGQHVSIGAFSIIGAGAVIGDDCRIDAHVTIADGVTIGAGSLLGAGVRLCRRVTLGTGAILHPNVVIGADGFSFVTEHASNEERALRGMGEKPLQPPRDALRHKIHSLGGAVIGDDVEIGANSTVDAGTIRPTLVGRGTKIDNLVQVGHNVVIGQDCVLCAQAAVAGSTRLGDRVVMGGKSGVRDNVTIGDDVVIGGGAIVLGNVGPGEFVMGYPAQRMPVYRAQQKLLRQKPVSKNGQVG